VNVSRFSRYDLYVTTRNTAIGCTLSEAVLREPHLKHYQQWFISSCPFQLLVTGLSAAVLHVEPLLIILWIISSGSGDEPLPIIQLSVAVQNRDSPLIMGCTINNDLLWEPLLIRLFYSSPYSKLLLIWTVLFIPLYFFFTCSQGTVISTRGSLLVVWCTVLLLVSIVLVGEDKIWRNLAF
jgi:hypothetical protein